MARLNNPVRYEEKTHEGAPASLHVNAEQMLRRSVLSCFLWEKEFYEDGVEIATRIVEQSKLVPSQVLADLAVEARSVHNLRHVPLLLLSVLADTSKGNSLVADTITRTIQRADELTEFPVVYAAYKGKHPSELKRIMTHGMRRGLADAFIKFSPYNLAKYNRDGLVKLRDVLFLCHARPANGEQKEAWPKLINGTLEAPDTWEVELSAGKDKKDTFERLIKDGKLGYFALLRNLRNMTQADCDEQLVNDAIRARKGGAERILPFRYVAAARAAPRFERALDESLLQAIKALPPLEGRTIVLVDVSGSMDHQLSARSDMTRMDAAATLASIINGNSLVFSFSNRCVECPDRRGMAGVDAIVKSQAHSATNLAEAIEETNKLERNRLIVITDEQAGPRRVVAPENGTNYMINVASNRNGISHDRNWVHIDGFSENVIKFIYELENFK